MSEEESQDNDVEGSLPPENIEERIAHIESNMRRWRQWAYVMGGVALLLVLLLSGGMLSLARNSSTTHVADVLQAQQIVLRDAAGNKRAEMAIDKDANLSMSLIDPTGTERLRFSVLSNGANGVTLMDRAGRTRLAFGILPDQSVNLAMADEKGVPRTVLGQGNDQSSTLVFAGPDGAMRAAMGVAAGGEPQFVLMEEVVSAALLPEPLVNDTSDTQSQ